MLAYVTTHLLNHAVGLVSVAAMRRALGTFAGGLVAGADAGAALWQLRGPLLPGAERVVAAAHACGCGRTNGRSSCSASRSRCCWCAMSWLPASATIISAPTVGNYPYLLWVYFVQAPDRGVLQQLVLFVAWGHAMLGLHFWLRVRPWYGRLRGIALDRCGAGAAVGLARDCPGRSRGRRRRAESRAGPPPPRPAPSRRTRPKRRPRSDAHRRCDQLRLLCRLGRGGVARPCSRAGCGCAAAARYASPIPNGRVDQRCCRARAFSRRAVSPASRMPRSAADADAARPAGYGFAAPPSSVPPPSENEQRVLNRIRAVGSVRLACQLRPTGAGRRSPRCCRLRCRLAASRCRSISPRAASAISRCCSPTCAPSLRFSERRLPFDVVFPPQPVPRRRWSGRSSTRGLSG